ncbi:hypothetical protein DFH06DRAFT_1136644 [Mycena polygramma]|nr:hypothetical protein DFH06DRAFT_1136644 [Mycena polygramma]
MSLSLVDLPTELLTQIFTVRTLSVQQLCSLALLCRRLHFTALPVYFSHKGLDSESRSLEIVMRTDRRDMLAALRFALFAPALHDIAFVFPHPSCTSIFPLLQHLKRVQEFLSRIPSINNVSLEFDHQDSPCLSVGNDATLRAWASGLGDLLNSVLETQCASLTVLYGGHETNTYELAPTALPVKHARRASWLCRLVFQHQNTNLQVATQGPPGFQLLRSCPISHLTFSKLVVAPDIWSTVLPLIASAALSLTSVTFLDLTSVTESVMIRFLAQLPALVELEIASSYINLGSSLSLSGAPLPHLPHLARLRAPPILMGYLLSGEGALPALHTATVLSDGGTELAGVAWMLGYVVHALDAHPRAHVPVLALVMDLTSRVWWDVTPGPTSGQSGVHRWTVSNGSRWPHLLLPLRIIYRRARMWSGPSRCGLEYFVVQSAPL